LDQDHAKKLFSESEQLFAQGQFSEALARLNELDRTYPNTKNILFPKAMCLAQMDRLEEAEAICAILEQNFGDQRSTQVRSLIAQKRQALGGGLGMDLAIPNIDDFDIAGPAIPATARPVAQSGPDYKKWIAVGVGVVVVLALIILPLVMRDPDATQQQAAAEQTQSMSELFQSYEQGYMTDEEFLSALGSMYTRMIVLSLPVNIAFLPLPLFLTLMLRGRLEHDTFWPNYFSAMLYMFIFNLAGILCCIGWILWFVHVYKKFDWEFVDIPLFIGVSMGVGIVQWFAVGLWLLMMGFA
jgi:hypothetical protein